MKTLSRRGFFSGLAASAVAAPAAAKIPHQSFDGIVLCEIDFEAPVMDSFRSKMRVPTLGQWLDKMAKAQRRLPLIRK